MTVLNLLSNIFFLTPPVAWVIAMIPIATKRKDVDKKFQ